MCNVYKELIAIIIPAHKVDRLENVKTTSMSKENTRGLCKK